MSLSSAETNEEELVRRIQRGDEAAFDQLMDVCGPRVFSLAYRMIGNHDDAQDVAQEAFIRIYRGLKKFDGRASFTTWMYRIVTNVCLNEIRTRKRLPVMFEDVIAKENFTLEDIPQPGELPEEEALKRERQEELLRALKQLPENNRLLVLLYDVQGLSYQQISDTLGVNVGTVKSRLNRARIMLREFVKETGNTSTLPPRKD